MDKCAFIWFYIYLNLFIYIYLHLSFLLQNWLEKAFLKDGEKSGKGSRVKVRKNKRKTNACIFTHIK